MLIDVDGCQEFIKFYLHLLFYFYVIGNYLFLFLTWSWSYSSFLDVTCESYLKALEFAIVDNTHGLIKFLLGISFECMMLTPRFYMVLISISLLGFDSR